MPNNVGKRHTVSFQDIFTVHQAINDFEKTHIFPFPHW